ncbi:MAG TPA: hypothetical protein DCS85_06050 [Verrucomicrobiales bacterium]|nr:hypothetical protein [Verrucomicrobiales bacterium]
MLFRPCCLKAFLDFLPGLHKVVTPPTLSENDDADRNDPDGTRSSIHWKDPLKIHILLAF